MLPPRAAPASSAGEHVRAPQQREPLYELDVVDLAPIVRRIVEETALEPARLALEVTETALVAEGVESEAEVRHLTGLGTRLAQGFHFFAPMPVEELRALLDDRVEEPARR